PVARGSARAFRRRRARSQRASPPHAAEPARPSPYDTNGAPPRRDRRRRGFLQRAVRCGRRVDHGAAAPAVRALFRASRDGDVARRDRDHCACWNDPLRVPRRRRVELRGPGRPPRERRRRLRHRDSAAACRPLALARVRSAPRGGRRPAAGAVTTILVAITLGLVAGVLSGLFGVGGGILFVPALIALNLSQLHAEATSLAAILPTVGAGLWRQQRYGNVRWRPALVIG